MNWEQQLEQIERQATEKAKADPSFAELVKTDFEEAVYQVSGVRVPFREWEELASASASDELSEEELELVVGGTSAGIGSIDISGMDLESALLAVQSQRVQAMDDALSNMAGTTTGDLQIDLLRLQSMANKRNEAFDLMTEMMKKMQDSRNAIIGNMR